MELTIDFEGHEKVRRKGQLSAKPTSVLSSWQPEM